MKTLIICTAIAAFISALELVFGTNDTGAKVALVVICWASLIVLGMAALNAGIKESQELYQNDKTRRYR